MDRAAAGQGENLILVTQRTALAAHFANSEFHKINNRLGAILVVELAAGEATSTA